MMTTQLSFISNCPGLPPPPPPPPSLSCRNGNPLFTLTSSSKNGDSSEDSDVRPPTSFVLGVSNPTIARSAITLFGLGLIDAGYSRDWSRIGVISEETEELLRIAAFVIVPLCLVLLFSIPTESE